MAARVPKLCVTFSTSDVIVNPKWSWRMLISFPSIYDKNLESQINQQNSRLSFLIVEDCHEPNKGALCLGTPCFAKIAPEGPAGAAWRENFLEIWDQNLTTPLF